MQSITKEKEQQQETIMDRTTKTNQMNGHLEELKKLGTLRQVRKQECLYNRTSQDKYVYFLEKGICALTSTSSDGKEHIYQYFLPGDFICFTSAFNRQYPDDVFLAFAMMAKADCVLYQIPYSLFRSYVDEYPILYRWLFEKAVTHYDNALRHSYSLQEGDNFTSLCQALAELAVRQGSLYVLQKEFSYGELANYLGIHTITVTRLIARLKEMGIVRKNGHQTVIQDMNQLKTLASGQ